MKIGFGNKNKYMQPEDTQNNGPKIEVEGFNPSSAMLKEKLLAKNKLQLAKDVSNRKFQIGKFDDVFQPSEKAQQIFSHSNFHRFLHASFAFTMFCTLLGASIFFGANAKSNSINHSSLEVKGKASITDNYKITKVVNNESTIFGGDIISTEKNSELRIRLNNQSEIRLKELTEIKIKEINDSLKIELIEGNVWIFSTEIIEVEVPKAKFIVENASANFNKNNKIYEITSWKHSVKGILLANENEKITDFVLPVGKRMFFAPSQITKEFSKLRFSKLKKELKFHNASADEWENKNIKTDEDIIFKIIGKKFVNTKTDDFFSAGSLRLKNIHKYLAFIPTKNNEVKNEIKSMLTKKAIKNASIGNNAQLKSTIVSGKFSNEEYEEIWNTVFLLSNTDEGNFLKAKSEIEDLWLNESKKDKKVLYRKFLNASLVLIEDFTKNSEDELLAKESTRYMDLWKKYDAITKEKDAIAMQNLFMHKEIVLNISQYYADRVDSGLLDIAAYVNDIALVNENENSQNILRLEIAQESLALTDTFIDKERFLLAGKIIGQTEQRLKLETVPEIFSIRDKILAKSSLVNEKINFANKNGELNEDEFQRYLADLESTERLLLELKSTENSIEEAIENNAEEKITEGDEELIERVRELFTEQDIVLYSLDFEDDSSDKFAIHRAELKNGKAFTATFNIENSSLSNVKFESGEELGSIFLSEIQSMTNRLFAQNDSSDNEEVTHAAPNEASNYDSNLVSLLKQLTQKKLQEVGITASQKNISIVSRQKTKIDSAIIDNLKMKISFEFDTKTMECTGVSVEEIELPDTNLENLIELITNNIEKKEKLDNLKNDVNRDFKQFGFEFEVDVNVSVDLNSEIARFSNISFKKSNETFSAFGAYDIKNQIFTIIAEKNGKFDTLEFIELINLEDEVLKSFNSNKSKIDNKEESSLSANLLDVTWFSEKELKSKVSDIFKENSCGFDASKFEIDEKNQKVVFRETWCDKMSIYGEYDAANENFSALFNPDYGIEREVDLESFIETIKGDLEKQNNEEISSQFQTTEILIKKLVGLFSANGCTFDENKFEASVEKREVSFKNVLFNNQEISGVYDTSNDIFKSVSCDAFGTKTNITMEDLSTKISEREFAM